MGLLDQDKGSPFPDAPTAAAEMDVSSIEPAMSLKMMAMTKDNVL